MYNTLERMYNIAYASVQYLGVAVVLLWLSTYILYQPPTTSVEYNQTVTFKMYRKVDMALFTFDLDADFTPCFNWNTKMIFVWVKAQFKTDKVPYNTATIWDTMITNKEKAHLQLTNERLEYLLMDFGRHLKGNEVELTVEWMVIPWAGTTTVQRGNSTKFILPEEYSN